MASVWTFQDPRQLAKHGPDKARWYVGYYDLDGVKRSQSCGTKAQAEQRAREITKALEDGNLEAPKKRTWAAFRTHYEADILSTKEPKTQALILDAFKHFERILDPGKRRMVTIRTRAIDQYIAQRRTEPGKKKGSTVSAATVNKELRHLKAAFQVAREWEYIVKVPDFRFLKELKKEKRYVTPEHFAAIYEACESARLPDGLLYPAADWWRALITFAYMTGWRIGECLALTKDDVDLETGQARTIAEENKGGRDERISLHPLVVGHLKTIPAFAREVFPWPHNRRTLDDEFRRIQVAAGINLPCRGKHVHTPACTAYSFHAFRRGFATMNFDRVSGPELQAFMRHKSYATTLGYIQMGEKLRRTSDKLFVPEIKPRKNA